MALRIVWILLLIASAIVLTGALMVKWVRFCTNRPPVCPPASVLQNEDAICDRPTIVCVGDSITHGRISFDYVSLLRAKFRAKGYRFVNAGMNGDMAYNVLQRLDDIIYCRPALVTILIGSNDAYATISPRNADEACKSHNLPELPSANSFRRYLSALCIKLREATAVPLALLSLPPFGEDPQHEAYRQAQAYSWIIKDVARQTGIAYLPINERMDEMLRGQRHDHKLPFDRMTNARYLSVKIRRFVLGQSLAAISRRYGYHLMADGIHLNHVGAEIIAEAIATFIRKVEQNDSLRLPRYCALRHQRRLDNSRTHAS